MTTAPPTGTVTFLFTDIEGSTKLSQQYPDAMPALLARHHEILRQSIQQQNGYIFQIIGDAFCAAFPAAIDAISAALDAQICLHNESWTLVPIRVRMGIHTGMAQLREDGQYSGYAALASTQRIMSAGHGGQILLSGATRELVRDMLPQDAELLDMGEKRLKDLLRPEHLYQLNAPGVAATFPPLKTLDSFPNNLPNQLTSFIGREKEIAEVKQELVEHRLVTLTGSGGTGKTRLSLQVAADLLEEFDHGVWFVELAPLTDPDLIPWTILSAIGIQEQQGKAPLESLKEYLHNKKSLIVLDNCEHLVAASAQLANTLLNVAPNLKMLASSREALGVKGELSYPVPSLSSPDVKHLPVIEQLSQYEAVRLFIDRASLVAPHFSVDNHNAPFIAQICHRLDGIPLAIELAATRVKVMSVEQISRRLDDRFRLLTGGARTSLPRQQTLRALIDWSYDLLTEDERLLLSRLSVFAGGWTLEAAEDVCAGNGSETYDVLELLTQLVNKSLVVVLEHSQSGETRYRMLETIRQYAREKLLEAGGSETIRGQHLTYFVKMAQQAEHELYRSNQAFWFNKLDDELDNFRMALEWALAKDIRLGLQIIVALEYFWGVRNDFHEVEGWLVQLLERYERRDPLYVRALIIYSDFISDFDQARMIAEQSLQLARSLSDKQAEALSLMNLGTLISLQGSIRNGFPLVEQSVALFQALGDRFGQANALEWLCINHNDLERSKAWVLESLKLYRELGHLGGIANCLNDLANRMIWGGDLSSPTPLLEEARKIYRQLGSQIGEAMVLGNDARLSFWQGDYQQAFACYEEALALTQKTGASNIADWIWASMAHTLLRQRKIVQAREMLEGCIQKFQKANNVGGLVYVMEGFASLFANQGQPERAVQFFAWADAMREKIGDHRPPIEQASVERDLDIIHARLDDSEFARLYEEGQGLTTAEAVALALQESRE